MRTKPQYNFVSNYCTAGSPVAGEDKHAHRIKGKTKRVSKGSVTPSHSIGGDPVICSEVHVGSSRRSKAEASALLGAALRKTGL